MSSETSFVLVQRLADVLLARGLRISAAESCTGGLIAAAATSLAGSSGWFERGYVTYSNHAKTESLGVAAALIARYGAVSEPCAAAMAEGCLSHSHADLSLSVTGIAGPGGAMPGKPVGMVCFGFAGKAMPTSTETCHFDGDRAAVRSQSVQHALEGMLARLAADFGHG